MINLFNVPNYVIDTSTFGNHLTGHKVIEFEEKFCEYVGAKHACSINSATSAIFLATLNKNAEITVPSIIPPVVLNAIINAGNTHRFRDDVTWVGDSYILHEFESYKIIDSAQKVEKNQYNIEANPSDLMIFSFYPTKPVGSIDGGIIVSDNKEKIMWFKEACLNGMSNNTNNWERKIKFPGWKMYMNSFQADIASRNLSRLDEKKERLYNVRELYNKSLGQKNSSEHLYRLSVENRENFISLMKKDGITCGVHYRASHLNPVYLSKYQEDLPLSEECDVTTVSIPYHENLTKQEVQKVIKSVRKHGNMRI
ncbi:MAG: hypothetical protein CMB80_24725 [Flammeovirgaceae bacterium]|nr:hypothetical protein [Flammeovirgaceae bacterium]